jgi:hypothetical protein
VGCACRRLEQGQKLAQLADIIIHSASLAELCEWVIEMPCVSQFFGISISMYYNDHNPPHFHASYGDDEASISIDSLEFEFGDLPRRARALTLEWASLHRAELDANWDLARAGLPLNDIAPLD